MIMTIDDLIETDDKDKKFNRRMKRFAIGLFAIAVITTILSECTMLPL